MKKILFLILPLGLISYPVFSKDFGIEGHVFPIIEEDILKVIEHQLTKIDIEDMNKNIQGQVKRFIESPLEVLGIKKTMRGSHIVYYDPTYILEENIYDHNGNLIYEKGKKINPLERVPLRENLVFIDGDDEKQVKVALNLYKKAKSKIILIKGSPLKLQRQHKVWIYFDQGGIITKKLAIKEVPALVQQEGLRLKIEIIGEDQYE